MIEGMAVAMEERRMLFGKPNSAGISGTGPRTFFEPRSFRAEEAGALTTAWASHGILREERAERRARHSYGMGPSKRAAARRHAW